MRSTIRKIELSGIPTVVGALLISLSGVAHAETGSNPLLDNLCFSNPAFAQPTANPVGLRKHNGYCKSGAYVPPPDYGSGPQLVVVP
jgi:hypothetical protein